MGIIVDYSYVKYNDLFSVNTYVEFIITAYYNMIKNILQVC